MENAPAADSGVPWFVALPDGPAGSAVADTLHGRHPGLRVVRHPGGRPWLLGRWAAGEVVVAECGDRRLAVLGEHDLLADDLRRRVAARRDAAGLVAAVGGAPGSFHVVAATPGGLELHGSLSGFRRVFYARIAGGPVAADRADVLADLLGADVDAERLAVHLLSPGAPWPLSWRPVWRGVEAVRPDERLVLPAGAPPRTVRRWRPPPATVALPDAAAALRRALSEAVRVRCAAGGVIASDLSGVDSTALCCLAAGMPARVVALTAVSADPLDDDLSWATRTAGLLGTVTHEVVPADQNPTTYDGLLEPLDRFDEPTAVVMYRAAFLGLSGRAAAHGARVRLTGFGGDELLTAEPGLQLSMLRSNPRVALRHLRLLRAAFRWPRGTVLRAALDRRSYPAWLATLPDQLDGAGFAPTAPILGWGVPPHVAPWVTSDAVGQLRATLASAAAGATAITDDPGGHVRLAGVWSGAAMVRHLHRTSCRAGLPIAVPYLDDAVLEACLSVRLPDVTNPREYKPLLGAAMRGIVPGEVRRRRGKADTSIATGRSAVRHRDQLAALADDSRLAGLGLIDPVRLRAALSAPDDRTFYELDQTLAGETWLRTATPARSKGYR